MAEVKKFRLTGDGWGDSQVGEGYSIGEVVEATFGPEGEEYIQGRWCIPGRNGEDEWLFLDEGSSDYWGAEEIFEEVDHPGHYNHGGIEAIDVIEAWDLGFHLGNAVKYISRAGHKSLETQETDIEKAIWYLQRFISTGCHE